MDGLTTKEAIPGGWKDTAKEALQKILKLHRQRDGLGYCQICGDKFPCLTWCLADAGLLGRTFDGL